MEAIFLKLLNMSAAAGWLILAVMALRLIFKPMPKWPRCVLWAIVAVRLICPFSLESPFSLIPSAQLLTPYEVQYAQRPSIHSGIPFLDEMAGPVLGGSLSPAPGASVTPLYVGMFLGSIVWVLGSAALLGYALASFLRIRRNVREAVPLRDNIWICDQVGAPFILGIFRPRIYLSSSIREEEMDYVLAHESAHLKRRDHWWKPAGYLLLSIYWFHPLVWAAYILFCRDMELACDERVVKDMDLEGKKAYSHALVSLSTHRKLVTACPLAFGEGNVKERVSHILNYKKPAFWIVVIAMTACIAAALCFLTDPAREPSTPGTEEALKYDIIPMVMADGRYYYDTGRESMRAERREALDGEITSSVDGSQKPQKDNESNFGAGYGYQYGDGDTLEILINGSWRIFEYRGGDGSMIRYLDRWYSQGDLSQETIEWLRWFNSLSPEGQLAVDFVPGDLCELAYGDGSNSPAALETNAADDFYDDFKANDTDADEAGNFENAEETMEETDKSALDRAIYAAIMEKNKSAYSDDHDLACCDFVMLETADAAPVPENGSSAAVICYGWALYQEYKITENGLEDVGGSHIPVALTFAPEHGGYVLKEYWHPRDGSYYVSDIRSKFPGHIADDGIDSQKFIIRQLQSCYSQAIQYGGLDPDAVIRRLLESLCSGPGASFNPQNPGDRNNTEYRELIYYGEYTLRYCLGRFESGGETSLEGRIMALICEELLQTRGKLPVDAASAVTGQFWYDTLLAHGANLVEPYLASDGN